MSTTYRRLTVAAWAAEINISKQAGYLAVKRCGIPIVDGKVDADLATHLYRNRTRYRVNPARMAKALGSGEFAGTEERHPARMAKASRPAAPTTAAELLELAKDIGQIMCDDEGRPHVFDEGLPHLMATLGNLARLDEAAVSRVRLPQRVADAVCAWLDSTADDEARP